MVLRGLRKSVDWVLPKSTKTNKRMKYMPLFLLTILQSRGSHRKSCTPKNLFCQCLKTVDCRDQNGEGLGSGQGYFHNTRVLGGPVGEHWSVLRLQGALLYSWKKGGPSAWALCATLGHTTLSKFRSPKQPRRAEEAGVQGFYHSGVVVEKGT